LLKQLAKGKGTKGWKRKSLYFNYFYVRK